MKAHVSSFHSFMLRAIELAAQHKWETAPNPAVGALLVKEGEVVASGVHKGPGTPHAEVAALADARQKGVNPADCTLVVTLEPCNHHGNNPPCTKAILEAGISHIVVGALDPNPEASGGIERLRKAGVTVDTGIAEAECLDLIASFITWQSSELPYTVLKLASTMDGRIATRTGHSKWITSSETRMHVHKLRQHMHAVLIGGNSFYQDDPKLTCRLEGTCEKDYRQPLAVVVTSRLPEAGAAYYLLRERPHETIFWTTVAAAASPKAEALRRNGIRVIGLGSSHKANMRGYGMRAELDLFEGLCFLRHKLHCHFVLCEGGGRLGLSLLNKGLAHELHLHLAPKILGDNEATPLFDGLAPISMEQALPLRLVEAQPSGGDLMLTMRPQPTHMTTDKAEA